MDLSYKFNDKNFKPLIELGTRGHFPLFLDEWLGQVRTKSLTKSEMLKVKKLITQLSKHKTIERKKTLLFGLTETDREIFIKAFLQVVEGKLLNEKLPLQ